MADTLEDALRSPDMPFRPTHLLVIHQNCLSGSHNWRRHLSEGAPLLPTILITNDERNEIAQLDLWTDVIELGEGTRPEPLRRALRRAARERSLIRRLRDDAARSKRLFHSFMENNQAFCFVKDGAGRYVYANAAFLALVGRSLGDVVGSTDDDLFSSEVACRLRENDSAVRQAGHLLEFEEVVPTMSGSVVSRVLKFPLPDVGGDGVLGGIAIDITSIVQAREELRRSQRISTGILDSVQAQIAVIDSEARVITINHAWLEHARQRGWTGSVAEGASVNTPGAAWVWLGVSPEAPIVENIRRLLSGQGTPFIVEYQTDDDEWHLLSASIMEEGEGVVVSRIDITDTRRAGIEAQHRRELFRSFMENSPVLTYAKNSQGEYVFVNRRFCEVMGKSADEMIGQTDHELWQADQAERIREMDESVLNNGIPVQYQASTTLGGETRHWYTAKWVVRDPDTGQNVVAGKSIDITDRVVAEQALRLSEERFHLAARATNDAVWDWDMGAGVVWFSENVLTLFGYELSGSAITLDWWRDRVHPDDRSRVIAGLEMMVVNGSQYWTDEYRFRRQDNTYATVLDRGYVIYSDGGEAIRMIGAISDITSRRIAENALRESEARFRRMVETAQEGVWVVDADGATTFANDRMAGMLGTTTDELVGEGVERFIPFDGFEILEESLRRRRMGESDQFDFRFVRADGLSVWTIISASPIFDNNNRFAGSLRMVADITPRKQAELELIEARDRLEARVRERTSEIEEMLVSLEQAAATQRRFVADASHDLRTPLTIIRAEIDLLLNSISPDSPLAAPLRLVRQESGRLEELAAELQIQASLDSGASGQRFHTARLDELLLDAISTVQSIARGRKIEWCITVAEIPVLVHCDSALLTRAFTNVLDNAVKFSHAGGAVEVWMDMTDGAVMVCCRDHGSGIAGDDLPHVFDRFYRADRSRATPGTGLGLSIVQRVVEAHGGDVTIESAPNQGTTVRIALPRLILHNGAEGDGSLSSRFDRP